ncbi:MAG: glycoside hydrolase family 13 protein [Fusobacterium gastrosuis]|uniref:glycoside hydrolase family 13 protein n=1 Tax=Fusobacterium gastrosuis TaxID=1755100 RepID=UPI002A8760A4|nr:glycoside hydrolase family 13 protein [Fusobacterium gastrosuis]
MKNVIYNPLINKRPSGASKNNEKNLFQIYIDEKISIKNLSLVIFNDKNENIRNKFAMNYLNKNENYLMYSVQLNELETGLYFYYFEFFENENLKYISNFNFNAEISDEISTWQLTVYNKDFQTPEWIKGGIIYQIFPDRFEKSENFIPTKAKNSEERIIHSNWTDIPNSALDTKNYSAKDFFMGNLNGILDKKNYMKSLNVNMIYLNPIFESSENHRYSTANYFKVDPFLGTNEIFKNLCTEFKNIGINFILDGVFSHTGSDSIYFNKYNRYDEPGAYNSKESKYYPWFKFIEYPEKYESWWGFENLPTLKKENADYIDFICKKEEGVLNYWQNLGIMGWRIDVLDEFPDVFIDELRKSIKEKNEEAFILGEVWEDASNKFSYGNRRRYLLGEQADSIMNYPWRAAIIELVKYKNVELFASRIQSIINNYPQPALDTMMNLLSSHDVERIITVLGTDIEKVSYEDRKYFTLTKDEYEKGKALQKMAAFLQFTLPGIPSIYYGEEIGMEGFRDPFNRQCFCLESGDRDLLEYYIQLTEFRKKYENSFKTGFKFEKISKTLISYHRNDILCIINLDDKPVIYEEINKGELLFSNRKIFFTDYGLVIGANSYLALNTKKGLL